MTKKQSKEELAYNNNPALKTLPDYLTIEGVVFEKMQVYTKNVALDLDDETSALVESKWRELGYTSPQAFIRASLMETFKARRA